MEETLNEFTKLHLKALNEASYYKFIKGNTNYEEIFRSGKSLEEVTNIFTRGIKCDDGTEIKREFKDILGFYLVNNNNLSNEDIIFLKQRTGIENLQELGNYVEFAKGMVSNIKNTALAAASKIQIYINEINNYEPTEYEIMETNEKYTYALFTKGRPVEEKDALFIFNEIEPNIRYPVIYYVNSTGKKVGKFSNKYPVSFTTKWLVDLRLPSNSITIITKEDDYTTFNFSEKTCEIKIDTNRINDDKFKKISNFMSMLTFVEENKEKKIVGNISFMVDKVIGYYSLYEYFIIDDIASTLFYIDETSRAWCSKDNFYVFFTDFSEEMLNLNETKTSGNYFKISIPTQKKENISGFNINFSAKNRNMLPSFLYKFSRLLTKFIKENNNDFENPSAVQYNKVKIFNKPIEALLNKAGELFKHETKSRDEKSVVSYGDYYSKTCQQKYQPIIINDDEVEDWIKYGREPVHFPPNEWGFKNKYWIVCPKDAFPIVNMKSNKQDTSGKIKYLPCCVKNKKQATSINNITNVTRKGISETINKLGTHGIINKSLAEFLSISYYKELPYEFYKLGTTINNVEETFNNSAIIALLLATDKAVTENGEKKLETEKEIFDSIPIIRKLMAKLPPDVYKQELYDMTDTEIITSILSPDTFIDPYLYYRGLEIIFSVQIFTFTSNIGRSNPISEKEASLNIATLELPRCKYMHIRHNNDKDIVCLYKNYGTVNKISKIPACELICGTTNGSKNEFKRVNSSNKLFFDSMFNLLNKYCHPIEWEKNNDTAISENCYDDPYSTINWSKLDEYGFNKIGKLVGQEIDIYGKTNALLFDTWTLLIPPTQPLLILETKTNNRGNSEYASKKITVNINGTDVEHEYYTGGTKKRAYLKNMEEACNTFEFTEIDDDGIWIRFNGKNKGIKILCYTGNVGITESFDSSIELVEKKNKVSVLLQIINWLWRSDWNGNSFPNFIEWWKENTIVEDSVIFTDVPNPRKNCNNMMLPECDSFSERMKEMTKLWPFFFYRQKIHVSKELYERIKNNFNKEDIYSRGLTPDDIYGTPGKFITDLIPTNSDFKNNNSIILTKTEHINDWVNKNNSTVFNYKSFNNCMVIHTTISNSMKNKLEHYIYKETIGDNIGQIYIIQNSSIASQPPYLSALHIAQHWKLKERNPGHAYRRGDDSEYVQQLNYVIYKINENSILEVYEDNSSGKTDYLQVLSYGDGETFGAMLPLLKKENN